MLLSRLKVLRSHGKQFIKDLSSVELPAEFRGRPQLRDGIEPHSAHRIESVCPTGAFRAEPFSIDLGRCIFCSECALMAPDHIEFTNDYRISSNKRESLIVTPRTRKIEFDPREVRSCILHSYGRALKLREVSAGGDGSCEMELNASMNVNFDFGRYGIEFVASPRHADGIVITGPITGNMSRALDICYCSIAEPKIIIIAGTDAVSGGIFEGSPALDRSFLDRYEPDLWIPGNPLHPMTFIDGIMTLVRKKQR